MAGRSEYDYKLFLRKGIGLQKAKFRWEYVRRECEEGLPESEFIYGKYLYSLRKPEKARPYFKRAADRNHGEAMLAGTLLSELAWFAQHWAIFYWHLPRIFLEED